MPDAAPNPELLHSLGRLVRGLSALFWGLPAALIICIGTASAGWFKVYNVVPLPLRPRGFWLLDSGSSIHFKNRNVPGAARSIAPNCSP